MGGIHWDSCVFSFWGGPIGRRRLQRTVHRALVPLLLPGTATSATSAASRLASWRNRDLFFGGRPVMSYAAQAVAVSALPSRKTHLLVCLFPSACRPAPRRMAFSWSFLHRFPYRAATSFRSFSEATFLS
eukprot:Polyplicarium_translucidae@DN2958_c0_g2_i4.p2